jgi:AraC-like DNA-binding protein
MTFRRLTSHLTEPGSGAPALVYSNLHAGQSAITRRSLCIKYVSRGTEIYHFGKRDYRLTSGQYMIVAPGEAVSATIVDGNAIGVCLFLPSEVTDDDFGWGALENVADPIILSARGRALGHFLARLTASLDARTPGQSATSSLLARAGALLFRDIADGSAGFGALAPIKISTRVDLIRRTELARAYMLDTMDRDVTIDELANHCALSPHHLCRTFKTLYGLPPVTYHRQLRLRRGFQSLMRGQVNVGQAAIDAGYADHAGFTKAFKRAFGRVPQSVRGLNH